MASFAPTSTHESRRGHQSPRPKGRDPRAENAKTVLCRNISLYGSCRTQNNGCPYNHDTGRQDQSNDSSKRFLNVESPAFTPLGPATNNSSGLKSAGISPKAAAAAIFTPKSTVAVGPAQAKQGPSQWPTEIREFVPQQFNDFQDNSTQSFNPYAMHTNAQSGTGEPGETTNQPQINPYAQDSTSAPIFQSTSMIPRPANYHLYAPIGPHRENLLPYQRTAHDLFIPDDLRQDLQRKSHETLQTFSNSMLPPQIEHFHSLVALDTTNHKQPSSYGHPSWLYKAVSNKDGYTYCLRRLAGFRLTDEGAIRSIKTWKRISNGNVVTVHDAFTTRAFGDSSLIVVTDYHPLSETVFEKYFAQTSRLTNSRLPNNPVPEHELWGCMVQLASALNAIHSNRLAARILIPQKILITSKNRVRLNACGILDVTQYAQSHNIDELQRDDLVQLGRLMLGIGTKDANAHINPPKALEHLLRNYSEKMHEVVEWLISAHTAASDSDGPRNTDTLLGMITTQMVNVYDASLHAEDSLVSNLSRELENARLFRLMAKFNFILERPDTSPTANQLGPNQSNPAQSLNRPSSAWSETGERYYLKLFRDYVFHQVDAEGRPMLDLGHVLSTLNKLDTAAEENIMLVSRDEQDCFVVSYKEIKRGMQSAWNDLVIASGASRR